MPAAGVAQGRIGLRRALLMLAAAGLLLGVAVAVAIATSRHVDHRALEVAIALVIGWGFVGAGLYAWWRRPENRFGALMTVAGFLFFVSELGASNSSLVFTVATLCGNLFLAVVVHMLLAMPSGRLRSRAERVFVVGMYVFASPLSRAYVLLADPRDFGCDGCPPSLALIVDDPDLAHQFDRFVNWVALADVPAGRRFLWRHWQQANRAERRVLGPVLVTGLTIMALLEVGLIGQLAGHATIAELGYYATQAAILPLPYAFLASLARSRVTRGDVVSELMASLAQAPSQEEIREALARALGDPELELAYWLPEFGTYADADGRSVDLDDLRDGRGVTLIGRNGGRVGALVHDPLLLEEQRLLDAVAGAAAISLENVRLNVELRARLEELRASRSRIVEAGDAERRRLERNLHDGAQQRLVAVALQLRLLRNRIDGDETAQELAASAAEELTPLPGRAARARARAAPGRARARARGSAQRARDTVSGDDDGGVRATRPAPAAGRAGGVLRGLRGPREHRQVRGREQRHRAGVARRSRGADRDRRRRHRRGGRPPRHWPARAGRSRRGAGRQPARRQPLGRGNGRHRAAAGHVGRR